MAVAASSPAFAGGYLTNTNQSVAFLRNPSQDAAIGIGALYNNPAGVNFLDPGFHFSLGLMNVHQNRDVTTTYAPFSFGAANNGATLKKFHGDASAPVVPMLQAAYNTDKWAFSFNFGIIGGGGKCEFNDGLASFESSITALSLAMNQYGFSKYNFDTYVRGRNYQFGFQFGAGYKVTDNLSVFGGLRLLYATNNYFGYIKNMQLQNTDGNFYTARGYIDNQHNSIKAATDAGMMSAEQANQMHAQVDALGKVMLDKMGNIGLNCNQEGWGVTPVIGVDWKINDHWNVAAKMEFKTRLRMKNQAWNENTDGHGLDNFDDGKSVAEDVPTIVTAGVMYTPIEALRLNAGFHYYWDKQATKSDRSNEKLSGGTWEVTAGAEYDFAKNWTISAGWQTTNYPNTDEYMRDISFTTNSNTIGIGVKYQVNSTLAVEAAYFQTFYKTYTRTQADYGNIAASTLASMGQAVPQGMTAPQMLTAAGLIPNEQFLAGTDKFDRTNRVIGVGVTLDF